MGLMIKKFNILGVHWKICFFGGGGVQEKKFIGGCVNCLKRGASIAKEGVIFLRWRGAETPMHTMSWSSLLIDKYPEQITLQQSVITNITNIDYNWHVSQKSQKQKNKKTKKRDY